jgi:hypothetical protein
MEGNVPDDHVRVPGEPEAQKVRADRAHVLRGAPAQALGAPGIDLDGRQLLVQPTQGQGQCAVTGAYLHDRPSGPRYQFFYLGDHRAVDQEVLAESVSSTVLGMRHVCAPRRMFGARQQEAPHRRAGRICPRCRAGGFGRAGSGHGRTFCLRVAAGEEAGRGLEPGHAGDP